MSADSVAAAAYPVRLEIAIPEGENRWMILIRWLLALPHAIVLYFLQVIFMILTFIAWWAILFTGKYPAGLFRFNVGVLRWGQNVNGYIYFHNAYPPFSLDEGEYDRVTLQIDRADSYSRWKIFLKWLFVIPHLIVVWALAIASAFAYLYVFFAVLITGRYPRGACEFVIGVQRWSVRASAYAMLLVDPYPPFSLD
jgi:hypothetical protein